MQHESYEWNSTLCSVLQLLLLGAATPPTPFPSLPDLLLSPLEIKHKKQRWFMLRQYGCSLVLSNARGGGNHRLPKCRVQKIPGDYSLYHTLRVLQCVWVQFSIFQFSNFLPAAGRVLRRAATEPHHAQRFADCKRVLDGAPR